MKKVLIIAVIAMAAIACKKSYTCKGEMLGVPYSQEYPDLTSKDAKEVEKVCKAGGGTWSSK